MNRAIDPLVHINFTKTISILALEPSGQRLQKISTVEMDVASVQLFPEGTPSKLSLVHIRLAFRTLIFLDMWPLKHGFLKGKKKQRVIWGCVDQCLPGKDLDPRRPKSDASSLPGRRESRHVIMQALHSSKHYHARSSNHRTQANDTKLGATKGFANVGTSIQRLGPNSLRQTRLKYLPM